MNDAVTKALNGATIANRRIDAVRPVRTGPPHPQSPSRGADFAGVLSSELKAQAGVKFSAHAQARIAARAPDFGPVDEQRLRTAVDLAAAKGARQSLVMLDGLALIVNVPSRTVITALDSDGARGTVFTNIDSAIIAQGGDATAL